MLRTAFTVFLALAAAPTGAADHEWIDGLNWKEREGVFLTLWAVDWMQTLDLADKMNDKCTKSVNWPYMEDGELRIGQREFTLSCYPDLYETNPILGKHPSAGEVNRYFLASAIVHVAVSWALPKEWKPVWQYAGIVVQTSVTVKNNEMGLDVKLRF